MASGEMKIWRNAGHHRKRAAESAEGTQVQHAVCCIPKKGMLLYHPGDQDVRDAHDLAGAVYAVGIHQKGKEALAEYQERHRQRTDDLVQTLRNLVMAYRTQGTAEEKLQAMSPLLGNRFSVKFD